MVQQKTDKPRVVQDKTDKPRAAQGGGQAGEMGVLAHAFAAADGKAEGGARVAARARAADGKEEGGDRARAEEAPARVDQAAVRAEREAEARARPAPVEVRLLPLPMIHYTPHPRHFFIGEVPLYSSTPNRTRVPYSPPPCP